MSDMNEIGSAPEAYTAEQVYGEGHANEAAETTTAEELFELIEGKNPDGTPIKKSLTKAELIQLAQKGFGADKSFEEAKATKEQMKNLARAMRDPSQLPVVLQKLGIDLDGFMQERMAQQMLENMKSPEEKEMEVLRKEAEEFRRLKAKQLKDHEESQIAERAEEIRHSLYTRINDALNTAGVPKTTAMAAEAARYVKMMAQSADRQGKPFDINAVKVENIVAHMRKQHQESFTSLFDELDEDGVLSMLPEPLQKKIAAALTKKLQGGKVTDINTIKRAPKAETNWGEAPARKKTINSTEANEIFEDKIAKAQAMWDKKFGR